MSRIAPPNAVESSPMSQRYELSVAPGASRRSVALTPAASSALITLPFETPMDADGIVMVGSAPAMRMTPSPPSEWFAMITPIAPLSCAFFTFTAKPQVPR
jgi:hypothetical protein